MQSISLCMIVKDEEKTLPVCLDSVQNIVDEIIIVDTGSSDLTKKAASQYTEHVYDFEWIDDFSAARNFSFSKATKDYILWLDADDIILPEDQEKLRILKENLNGYGDAYMFPYNTGFDDKGNITFSYFRERLVKNKKDFFWVEPVHEYIKTDGTIINCDIHITHTKKQHRLSDRNIKIYEKVLDSGENLSTRGVYYYARELRENGQFAKAIDWYSTFLNSGLGWSEDNIIACGDLARCYEALDQPAQTLSSLFRSFIYDTPRAEICCQVGYFYKNLEDYSKALFWFDLATHLQKPAQNWGFIQHDCWGYIPNIEASVCSDKLGFYSEANEYNEKAGAIKPDDPSYLYNKKYFEQKKYKKSTSWSSL